MSAEKLRLFVGCGPLDLWADNHKRTLVKIKSELKKREIETLWSPNDNLHITLSFIGDSDSDQLSEIIEKLKDAAANISPFQIKTKGLGAFPELESARILFADVAKSRDLLAAQTKIENALGLSETNEYHPHITLARLRNLKSLRKVIEPWKNQLSDSLEVNSFRLFKSVPQGAYRQYIPIQDFPLTSPLS